MLSLIVAIIVSITVGSPTNQPGSQNPNTGKPTKENSDPSTGTMGGVGHWAEGRTTTEDGS